MLWESDMLRVVVVGATLVASLASAASAADLPAKTYTKAPAMVAPVYNWGGFYLGLNGGGGWSDSCWTLVSVLGAPVAPAAAGCPGGTGGLAGGQIGYRWQAANWVFGLEAQGNWANIKGSDLSPTGAFGGAGFAAVPVVNQTRTDAIGLFTGQVGYAWNHLLGYVKGGAALAHNVHNGTTQLPTGGFPAGFVFDESTETRWGGVVGLGVEYGFAPNWSVAVEYDHLFMGRRDTTFLDYRGLLDRTISVRQDIDIATVRVNYTFGRPVVARY